MSMQEYLVSLLSYLPIIPSAFLCFAPVRNRLHYKPKKILILCACSFAVLFPALSYFEARYSLGYNTLELPLLILLFFAYHKTLDTTLSQSLSVFVLVTTLMAFMSNFSNGFDALLHPTSDLDHFSLEATVFQLFICSLLAALLYHPFSRFGSYLIDNLSQKFIWYVASGISGIFLVYNLNNVVHYYNTLHTNNVGRAYITNMILFFLLILLLNVIFYFLVNSLLEKAKTDERDSILEMQEKRYDAQQKYLEDTARARHDFRHILRTLRELSEKGDNAAVLALLDQYIEKLPEKESKDYCGDLAVNALLNHYAQMAAEAGIHPKLSIALPDPLQVNAIDLCSVLGNILDNAIDACRDIPESDRFIALTVSPEQGGELYIAASNSFNGKPKHKGQRYFSTKRGGSGIGLISIAATAEQYGGSADFYHEGNVFYSNVMMVNRDGKEDEAANK